MKIARWNRPCIFCYEHLPNSVYFPCHVFKHAVVSWTYHAKHGLKIQINTLCDMIFSSSMCQVFSQLRFIYVVLVLEMIIHLYFIHLVFVLFNFFTVTWHFRQICVKFNEHLLISVFEMVGLDLFTFDVLLFQKSFHSLH